MLCYVYAMNFSIHLEDSLLEVLNAMAQEEGRSRNALIREAIAEYLRRRGRTHWPAEVERLAGAAPDLKPFESHRSELKHPPDDPLA